MSSLSKEFILTLSEQQLRLLGRKWLLVIANHKFGEQTKMAQRILNKEFFNKK